MAQSPCLWNRRRRCLFLGSTVVGCLRIFWTLCFCPCWFRSGITDFLYRWWGANRRRCTDILWHLALLGLGGHGFLSRRGPYRIVKWLRPRANLCLQIESWRPLCRRRCSSLGLQAPVRPSCTPFSGHESSRPSQAPFRRVYWYMLSPEKV